MSKEFQDALKASKTVRDLHKAMEKLPLPSGSTTAQQTTLADLIKDLEASSTRDGSEKAPT